MFLNIFCIIGVIVLILGITAEILDEKDRKFREFQDKNNGWFCPHR